MNKGFINGLSEKIRQNRLIKDSLWALVGNVANKGLALLAGIAIARFLGKEAYGQYGMIKNTLLYIAVFSTFGLGFSSTKFIAQLKDTTSCRLKAIIKGANIVSLGFSSIMAFMVFFFAHELATYLEAPEIVRILKFTALTIVVNSLATVQIGILAGLKLFKYTAKINMYVGVVTFLSSVVFTYYWDLEGAILALFLSNIVNCVLNYFYIKQSLRFYPKSNNNLLNEIKNLIKFSIPIAIQESTFSISYWLGILLLVKLSNYGEVGLFSAATQWAGAILFIPSVLQNVILSHLSSVANNRQSHNLMLKKIIIINLISTFIPFIIIFFSSNIIVNMYGTSYEGLALVLNISVATTIFRCLVQVYVQEYIALGKTWTLCLIRLSRDFLSLLLSYILISNYHDNAAALYSVSYLVSSFLCLVCLIVLHNIFYEKNCKENF